MLIDVNTVFNDLFVEFTTTNHILCFNINFILVVISLSKNKCNVLSLMIFFTLKKKNLIFVDQLQEFWRKILTDTHTSRLIEFNGILTCVGLFYT